jgi:hypothetical protein
MYSNDDALRQKIAKKSRVKYFKYLNSTIFQNLYYKPFSIDEKNFW